jgi:hypothetical protein
MWYPNLNAISHWFFQHEALTLATLATLCAAMLIGCAVGCVCSPRKEKDQIFHRTVF